MTADTVATDTPAWAATSLIVAGRSADSSISLICFASSMRNDGSCPLLFQLTHKLSQSVVVLLVEDEGGWRLARTSKRSVCGEEQLLIVPLIVSLPCLKIS